MTLNNFEKKAKERLDNRTIQPSTRAWKEISGELEKQPKTRPGFYWYGIAAGFIGILIISGIYFLAEQPVGIEQQVVVIPEDNKEEKQAEESKQPEVLPEKEMVNERAVVVSEIKKPEKEQFPEPEKEVQQLAANELSLEKEIPTKVEPAFTEEVIDAKLKEVLAKVSLMEHEKNALSDAEVDSLLRQAQREILTDRIINEDNSVNATALLTEVEEELDQSFRDQIFDKLKTGFKKVRTAVADRNN